MPIDLVTTSGSGLDPHISPAAAEFQVPRVARERGMSEEQVRQVIAAHTEGRQFGFLGEPTSQRAGAKSGFGSNDAYEEMRHVQWSSQCQAPWTTTDIGLTVNENGNRPSPESLLAKLNEGEQAKLRVYIGAAPGVGKTYQMLEDAHLLKKQGADIVVAAVETHGREDTKAMIGDLERVPMRRIEYRGVTLEEMDRRCGDRSPPSHRDRRRTCSHERSWLEESQTLPGRSGFTQRRHFRNHRGKHSASRITE